MVLALFIFPAAEVWAHPSITLKESDRRISLGPASEYHRDPSGRMNLRDVLSLKDPDWTRFGEVSTHFKYTRDAVWIRFLINDEGREREWILESPYAYTDMISLFKPGRDGSYERSDTGRLLPFSSREIENKNLLFRMKRIDGKRPYYVRFRSDSALNCDLTLWQPESLAAMLDKERFFDGIFYGVMLVMVLYNFSIFVGVRDAAYLYYSIYQIFVALFIFGLEGYSSQYFFPNTPFIAKHSFLTFGGLLQIFGLLFVVEFLRLKENFPLGRWMILSLIIPNLFQISNPLVGYINAAQVAQATNIVLSFVVIICAVVCLVRGYKPARFFLIAWIAPLFTLIYYALARFNVVPYSFMTEHGTQIGCALEAWLLSIALADRYSLIHTALEKAHEKLLTLDRMKDEFLATTSHELKTPLIGIGGIAESLLSGDRGRLPQAIVADLGMIVSSAKRLTGLVNDLLDLSRLKHRDLRLRKGKVDLRQVVDLVLAAFAPLVQGKEIALKNLIGCENPFVYGDENRLQQVMYNLIDNAVKFTDSGEVCVSARCVHDFVRVTVEDTGIGIPEEKFDDIFKYFEQGDSSDTRRHGGAGIGLSITRQLIEMQGGFITVESRVGAGSKFIFTLPVYSARMERESAGEPPVLISSDATADDAERPPVKHENVKVLPQSALTGAVQTGEKGKGDDAQASILVVDDEPINLRVLEGQLRQAGYRVISLPSGPRALEHIETTSVPDIILLDIMMPGMSGYEVCGILRNKYSLHELPIIMITVKNQIVDLVTGFEAGANDYLSKPFDRRELLARVNTLVTLKRTVKKFEESRYKNLQERTNPHFLFNAINTIHALLYKDVEKADAAVIMLADIFRYLMDTSFLPLIPFDTEWEFIRTYLKFESIRFPDTIRFEMEKNGDFSGVMIPPLTLQPLAENSVKHGIRHKTSGGKISIKAGIEGNRVRVTIEDNGVGIGNSDVYSRTVGNIMNMLRYHYKTSDVTVKNRKKSGAVAEVSFLLDEG